MHQYITFAYMGRLERERVITLHYISVGFASGFGNGTLADLKDKWMA